MAHEPADHGTRPAPSPALPAPVAARWSGGGDLPTTVEALPPAPLGDGPVPLQRLASVSGVQAASGAPAPGGPREIVFPPRDGLGAATTGRPGLAGAALAGTGAAGAPPNGAAPTLPGFAAAPASGAAQPPAMTLHHAPTPVQALAAAAPAPAPVMQRIVAEPPAPVVQTSRPGATALPGISATPVVQRVDGAAPDPGGAPGGHSDTELDELARALFGRMRNHLRSEVIHEREAKGLSFDAF
jgi:hypothetical protein